MSAAAEPPVSLPSLERPSSAPRPTAVPTSRVPRPRRLGAIAGVALLSGAVGAGTGYLAGGGRGDGTVTTTVVSAQPASVAPPSAGLLQDAIAQVEPSMVVVKAREGGGGVSQGSGVVTSPRGLVVTNEHVVGSTTRVQIVTADGRTIAGTVVRKDAEQDLAVIRTASTAGPGVAVAEEPDANLRLGDTVFAIGSPFGLQNTVTAGIVSAFRDEGGRPLIQFDAPINPGNSGGGLFNLRGQLVGIPTSIQSPIPGNVGLGFAIPASRVRAMVASVG